MQVISTKNFFFLRFWAAIMDFQSSKTWMFFGTYSMELFWKSPSGRNSSWEPPVFWFSNSLPYDLEESRELRDLIRWVLGWQTFKNAKTFCQEFFFAFLSRHYRFTNYFEIPIFAFSNSIPRGVSICKILPF